MMMTMMVMVRRDLVRHLDGGLLAGLVQLQINIRGAFL